ncbi:hypothetical protein JNUCC64_20290 [Streptomyces sp. JNUCC 64]
MSTVDPAAARREEERRRSERDRPGAPLGPSLWAVLLLYGGLWALCGYGAADMAAYPLGSVYLSTDLYPVNDTPVFLWAFLAGLVAAPIVRLTGGDVCLARRGEYYGPLYFMALAYLGVGLGVLFGARERWVRPPKEGVFVDGLGLGDDEWHTGAWVAWTAQWWVPALLVVVFALRLGWTVHRHAARRRRDARAWEVIHTGLRVPGQVTDSTPTGTEVDDRFEVEFVVLFSDRAGADRWVTKRALFDPGHQPRSGDRAVVWFDPAAPDDQRAILVALTVRGDDIEHRLRRGELPYM